MNKYRVEGKIGGEEMTYYVEAAHGADAIRQVVRKHMPDTVRTNKESYYKWYEDNVRLNAVQLDPGYEPPDLATMNPPKPAKRPKGRKTGSA